MTDLRKAAEMALEILDMCFYDEDDKLFCLGGWHQEKFTNAREALRQALAQPEQEAFTLDRGCWERGCAAYDERDGDGVNILAERVEKPVKSEQEPVAWMSPGKERLEFSRKDTVYGSHTIPLYTAPPKREWVGLTNEERFLNDCRSPEEIKYAIAIEAKLKEKNT